MAELTQTMPSAELDVRKDFPLLSREVNGRPIVYLDSASSSQRPQSVLDAIRDYDRGRRDRHPNTFDRRHRQSELVGHLLI